MENVNLVRAKIFECLHARILTLAQRHILNKKAHAMHAVEHAQVDSVVCIFSPV